MLGQSGLLKGPYTLSTQPTIVPDGSILNLAFKTENNNNNKKKPKFHNPGLLYARFMQDGNKESQYTQF